MLIEFVRKNRRAVSERGDTIIEVLLSVTILGMVLALSFTSTGRSLNAGTDAANRNQALAYGQEQVELLRSAANSGTLSDFPTNSAFCVDPSDGTSKPSSDAVCKNISQSQYGVAVKYNSANQTYDITSQWQGQTSINQTVLYYQVPINPISAAPSVGINITASPTVIPYNGSTSISWSTTNAASCTASGGNKNDGWAGDKAVQSGANPANFSNLKTTTTYSLTCKSSLDNSSLTRSARVAVSQLPAPTVKLNANPQAVNSGNASNLTWSTTNAFKCTASGGWSGDQPTSNNSGVSTGPLTTSQTYTLQCLNTDGISSGSDTTTVKVNAKPTVSFSASPTSISYKDSSTLTWTSSGASNCVASGAWSGNKGTSGPVSTGPLTTSQTYYLRCDGPGGSSPTASVTISVGPSGINGYYYQGANFNSGGWGPYNDGQINWCSSPSCDNGWLPVFRARTYMSEASCASVYWVGQILADSSGNYKMETFSDDGVRLAINGNYVINNWTQHSETYDSNYYYMSAGWHSIQVWYQNNNGNGCSSGSDYAAAIQLIWTPPGAGSRNQVPQDHLRPY